MRTTEGTVTSADGTTIAYDTLTAAPRPRPEQSEPERPPIVLVEAAGHHRGFSSFDGLAPLLAEDLTVVRYDRRGRGASGDTPPYAVAREVEDLAALLDALGGRAYVYGFSSGALLALHAAAAGLDIPGLVLLEPPISDDETSGPSAFTHDLDALVADGRHEQAVAAFHEGIGVPDEVMTELRGSPAWDAMVAIAPTLAYDAAIGDASPPSLLARVDQPVLVLDSEGSGDDLGGMAATVARHLPQGTHRSLPGEWHGVADALLAATIRGFVATDCG